ncbi:cytokine receptor [Drosophila montana]|uniref:cytokine receptor n=1 Tax=Drosophila montana TaxID=40370 RepID=UPI00313D300C
MLQLRLGLVIVACLAHGAQCLTERNAHLANVLVAASRLDLRAGDAYNVSCSFAKMDSLLALCPGGMDNINIRRQPGVNLKVSKLNATSVYHEVLEAEPKHSSVNSYECLCNGVSLGSVKFMVGVRLAVKDFECRYRENGHLSRLNCSFSRPPLGQQVDWTTSYRLQYRQQVSECRVDSDKDKELMHCSIAMPDYNRFADVYDLTLSMRDQLPSGSLQQQHFQLSRMQCIEMEPPGENATVLLLNSSAICLDWSDSSQTNHIGYNISWQLELVPTPPPDWPRPQPQRSSPIRLQLCLAQLPYSYYNYTFRLSRRYNDSRARWSKPYEHRFQTAPALPARPPAVWPSGYHRNPEQPEEVRVYWQQLDKLERNGPQFEYHVRVLRASDKQHVRQARIAVESNMAIIRNVNPSEESYIIEIRSRNAIGMSTKSSQIRIPQLVLPGQRIPRNVTVSKTAGSLSWEPPEQGDNLLGYTVYWCRSNVTDRSHCNETVAIASAELVQPTRCYYEDARLRLDSYEWGISANYEPNSDGSGGIHWLEWHYGALVSQNNERQVDWMNNLQGIVALVVLGVFIHMIVRKFRSMSDIDVVFPVGVLSPQQQQQQREQQDQHQREQLLPTKLPEQLPLRVVAETSIGDSEPDSESAMVVQMPAVLRGNFMPLDVLVVAPAAPQTDYVSMQLAPQPAAESRPVPLKRPTTPANPRVHFASNYIRMQPRPAPDYVTPPRVYR